MDTINLIEKFTRIGARAKVTDQPSRRRRPTSGSVTLDIQSDRHGEYFEVFCSPAADPDILVLDVQRTDRHLLLMVRNLQGNAKFLCGHDERHWFVAAIPESEAVGTVRQAKEALKPAEVQTAQARERLSATARNRRKNRAYSRQGEWFFLPASNLVVAPAQIPRNEPIQRGNGGKPHWAEFCWRTGGDLVYVGGPYQNGVPEWQYRQILHGNPDAASWRWRTFSRNPDAYVRGAIRHADHKTIVLRGWHRVLMNTENRAEAMKNVAFLD